MSVFKVINTHITEDMVRGFLSILDESRRKRYLHKNKIPLPEKLREIFKKRIRDGYGNIARIFKRLTAAKSLNSTLNQKLLLIMLKT